MPTNVFDDFRLFLYGRVAAVWPTVDTIWDYEIANRFNFREFLELFDAGDPDGYGLPFAVCDFLDPVEAEWGVANAAYEQTATVWIAVSLSKTDETEKEPEELLQEITGFVKALIDDLHGTTTYTILEHRPIIDAHAPINEFMISKKMPIRAGAVVLKAVVGETQ
jgi:hypothetical protein